MQVKPKNIPMRSAEKEQLHLMYDNTKTASQNASTGAYRLATNTFSDDPGSGATGKWSVYETTNTCGTYSFLMLQVQIPLSGDAGVIL
jgi:hypothetical protein